MRVSKQLKTMKKKWSDDRENYLYKRGKSPMMPTVASPKSHSLSNKQRREAIEGNSKQRREMLDFIYKRDRGICYSCGKWLPRSEATREHLFRPLVEYPHLAKDPIYIALAHKECNK